MNVSLTLSEKIAALRPEEPFYIIGDTLDGVHFINETVKPVTQEELAAAEQQIQHEADLKQVEQERQAAYQAEADPLYFQWQAGESTEEVWQLKRAEIRERYPYPTNEEVK